MKKFYKISVCLVVGLLIAILNFSNARISIGEKEPAKPEVIDPIISGNDVSGNIDQGSHGLTTTLQGILQFPERTDYTTPLGYALKLIQVSINWILGILATVALVYMLYCGFLVFSSGADDKNSQKGRKGISTAAIALAGIGLSWLIVSVMIRFINLVTKVS